ncbi:MAG: beta-lactamase family protein [Gammaproteobacteria bacterium]|nr:beta-lactamase family protein [Gammaproteobacteria bacterium]
MRYILFIIALTWTSQAFAVGKGSPTLSKRQIEDLTRALTHAQRQANVPALGLVLMDAGRPLLIAAWGDDVDTDTPFRWGSISKTFTALALLRLVEQGKVGLTDPVREYLPENTFSNPWAASRPIRLLHLLELSGGLGDLSGVEFNLNEPLSLAAALALNPAGRVSRWPPGLQHSYTNVNPGLTAAVIEQATQRRFEDFVKAEVLAPMNMKAASFLPVQGLPGGFKADGSTEIPYWHMTFRAFGALNASLTEMSHFMSVLLNDGRLGARSVFTASTLAGLYRAHSGPAGETGLEVGYGTGAYGWVSNGHVFHGHGGDADGYRSRYGLLKSAARGYLVVINTDNPRLLRRLQKTIEQALSADLEPPTPAPAVALSPALLASYAGPYYPASVRFDFERWTSGHATRAHVEVVEQGLVFFRPERSKRRVRLIPLGDGRFRRPTDPVATVVFAADASGSLYLQGELGNFVNLNSKHCPGFIPVCDSQ